MRFLITYIFLAFSVLFFHGSLEANDDIKIIKNRVVIELMKPTVDDTKVEHLMTTLGPDGTWPGINYADVSRTAFEHRHHSGNMVILARALKNKGSKYYKSKEVRKTIERALQNWTNHDYFCDNWWHNQIGTPNNLVALMLLVGNELPSQLVEKTQPIIGRATIDAGGARPGGDRIKIASIQAKNQLFLGNDEKFKEVVKVIEGEIKFVEWIGMKWGYSFRQTPRGFSNRSAGGRGIQYDNSFHHRADGVNNTLSYGLGYADAFVEWALYTNGTQYSFSKEKLEQLVDYFLDGICKTAVFGKYPDAGVKNRSFTRQNALRAYSAKTAEQLLLTTNYRKREIQEIVDIRNLNVKPTISHATFFWHSEHFTFQRPDFFTSVRLYSTRTYNMEEPYNSEGLFNHHRGDGTNHISRTGDEYYDIAPVMDYQKIPGTTVVQKPSLPSEKQIQKLGLTDFAGAATDGKYAVVGFDFKSPHDTLCARKAWFFFDEEYACLGAGISSRQELPVVTTLNQCLLRDDVTISENSKISVLPRGEKKLEDVDWIFHDGIGYVFPKPSTINIKNSEATGSWYLINKQTDSPKNEVKKDVFKLWLDHGKAPSEITYEYIVVPATNVENLEKGSSKANITILSNSPEVQAVRHKELNIIQMVFYKSGVVEYSDGEFVKSDSPGVIILKTENGKVQEITVSDPNRELGKMNISISGIVNSDHKDVQTAWNEKDKMSHISVVLPQGVYAGKSVTVTCK